MLTSTKQPHMRYEVDGMKQKVRAQKQRNDYPILDSNSNTNKKKTCSYFEFSTTYNLKKIIENQQTRLLKKGFSCRCCCLSGQPCATAELVFLVCQVIPSPSSTLQQLITVLAECYSCSRSPESK